LKSWGNIAFGKNIIEIIEKLFILHYSVLYLKAGCNYFFVSAIHKGLQMKTSKVRAQDV
jgi:hypothetical protein